MSSSTTNSTTAFGRYRSAILVLSLLAAGCTVYHIHRGLWPTSSTPSQTLSRRNAVLRRNHRRRNRAASSNLRSSENDVDSETALRELLRSRQYFGDLGIRIRGVEVLVPLRRGDWPTANDLVNDYSVAEERAWELEGEIQAAFLGAFFASLVPLGGRLADREGLSTFRRVLSGQGFRPAIVSRVVSRFNSGLLEDHPARRERREREETTQAASLASLVEQVDGTPQETENPGSGHENNPPLIFQEPIPSDTVQDVESENSWQGGDENNDDSKKEGQSLLNLLYHIAEDQARRDGYVHRGVTCNSCNTMPIRGIRYRCANCQDFDLCEQCEAMQIHPKTHIFYKVRIPAPFLGNPRQPQSVWYPGKPSGLPQHLSKKTSNEFCRDTGFEVAEIDALWDQFKCLAGTEWPEDPNELGIAIDRRTFDKCFCPGSHTRPPPPNLIYDRMFSFYDFNADGLIGFGEFISGLSILKKKNQGEKLKQIFKGYDIDGDGYVSRKDFLLMFRANYALTKELTRDMIAGMEEDVTEGGGQRDTVMSSQPISSAFSGAIPPGERSREGEGKVLDLNGDFVLSDRIGMTLESELDEGDHYEAIADVSERARFGDLEAMEREPNMSMILDEGDTLINDIRDPGNDPSSSQTVAESAPQNAETNPEANWPESYVLAQDAESALGRLVALREIIDTDDRHKVRMAAMTRLSNENNKTREAVRQEAMRERRKRRHFYLDGEDGTSILDESEEPVDSLTNGDPEIEYQIQKRMDAIKHIRASTEIEAFQISIREEISRRSWYSGEEADTSSLVDRLVNMAGQSILPELMMSDLRQLGYKYSESSDFIDWFIQHTFSTEAELRKKDPAKNKSVCPSRRSRSSSKVRFQDDLTETRSNTSMSSRSIPIGERWGDFEIPEPEQDVGREILYQIVQEGLNELLDPIFRQREDLAMEAMRTSSERKGLEAELLQYMTEERQNLIELQINRFQKIWRSASSGYGYPIFHRGKKADEWETIGDKLQRNIADEHNESTQAYAENLNDMLKLGLLKPATKMLDIAAMSNGSPDPGEAGNPTSQKQDTAPDPSQNAATQQLSVPLTTDSSTESNTIDAEAFPPAALELHDAVKAFEETVETLEQSVRLRPLSELIAESGYSLAEEPVTDKGYYDPTLPQHRPNRASESLDYPSPASSWATTAAHSQLTSPFLRPSPDSCPQPFERGNNDEDQEKNRDGPIGNNEATVSSAGFQDRLKFLAMMKFIEDQDVQRGGPGKLSFEEFEEIMKGSRGPGLMFVGEWIEMAIL